MHFVEKRHQKTERRLWNEGPPPGFSDRRRHADRRQITVQEISFDEWASHLALRRGSSWVPGRKSIEITEQVSDIFERQTRR